ncbi:MAG: hypothetical protein ACD_2C00091G0010 [uncultured bacterium (gcode 4)]|uniref:DUF2784 domain-containing protein n=1 Tax=uncultured bacterium (gcode 4) TaxID=1234023 RepID=K2GHB0_9BACT|nr:MAG: hypothetical protein ACD_2C00091G0010 [uncultured bacterium (gcode 4)]
MKKILVSGVNLLHSILVINVLLGWIYLPEIYAYFILGILLIQKTNEGRCPLTDLEWYLRGCWPAWKHRGWFAWQIGRVGIRISESTANRLLSYASIFGIGFAVVKLFDLPWKRKVKIIKTNKWHYA